MLLVIVLVNVMAETFLDLVRKKNTGREQALFIDSKGYYYVHPDRAKEWGRKSDLGHGANFSRDYPEVAGQVVGARAPATVDQESYLIAVSPVFLDKGRSNLLGDIVDIVPTEVVFAPVLTFRNIFLAISAGVFLFTLVLALNLAKSITEPIVYLTRITHDMSKGKLATPVSVTSRDETRLLAESVERLRKSMVILLKRMKKK
jgi:HAMP domain-containing protein